MELNQLICACGVVAAAFILGAALMSGRAKVLKRRIANLTSLKDRLQERAHELQREADEMKTNVMAKDNTLSWQSDRIKQLNNTIAQFKERNRKLKQSIRDTEQEAQK